MPRHVSFDDLANLLVPVEGALSPPEALLQQVREVTQDHPEMMSRIFGWLPAIDRQICLLYFIDGVTQECVSDLLGLGQPEVSGRLHSCIEPLAFLARRPTLSSVQARTDLSTLLPNPLWRTAHSLYLNFYSARRVAELLGPEVSESTIRNRRKEVVEHLGERAALPHDGLYEQIIVSRLGLINASGAVLESDELARRGELASRYLEDLRRAKKVSARFWRPFRKNELVRANALVQGKPVVGPPGLQTKAKRFVDTLGRSKSTKS